MLENAIAYNHENQGTHVILVLTFPLSLLMLLLLIVLLLFLVFMSSYKLSSTFSPSCHLLPSSPSSPSSLPLPYTHIFSYSVPSSHAHILLSSLTPPFHSHSHSLSHSTFPHSCECISPKALHSLRTTLPRSRPVLGPPLAL